MNQTGKDCIMRKFEERFQRGYQKWNPFKNRYDTCKKKYATFRLLTHNRPMIQYDDMGRLEMPDDWWQLRIEVLTNLVFLNFVRVLSEYRAVISIDVFDVEAMNIS